MAGGNVEDGGSVSPEFLRRWGQLRWESVLHYMVSLQRAGVGERGNAVQRYVGKSLAAKK